MDNENNNDTQNNHPIDSENSYKGLKIFNIVLLTFVLVIFGFFTFFAIKAPHSKAKAFQEKYAPKVDENAENTVTKSLEILALENEIAFQRADISMAKNDSIYLLIDLIDSVISMEMQGVSVQDIKIIDFKVSPFLKNLDPQILNIYLSKPFKVKHTESTIPKNLIKTKIAPKNEEEANSQKADSIKEERNYIRYSWHLNRDLIVEVVQDSISSDNAYRKENREILLGRRFNQMKAIIDSAIHLQPVPYTPKIELVLSRKDARTLFRSTPYQGMMAIRYGFKGMKAIDRQSF